MGPPHPAGGRPGQEPAPAVNNCYANYGTTNPREIAAMLEAG